MSVLRKEFGALAALVAVPIAAPSVVEAPQGDAAKCVTTTLSIDAMRRGETSEVECYRTFNEMLDARGLAPADGHRMGANEAATLLGLGGAIARHHEHQGGGGTFLIVNGSCDGGGIALPPEWNDRFSSTTHGLCGKIKHFSEANATGDYQITFGTDGQTVNVNGQLNDRVSSIYYYAA
jgi:hypothetical protein